MPMRQSFRVTDSVTDEIKPYVQAMMDNSGLNEFDATTSVLFALLTQIDVPQYPLLLFLGVAGSGKSSAMKQLFPMCKQPKWVSGATSVVQRNQLVDTRTAFLEEADTLDTDLYTRRYSQQSGTIEINQRKRDGWEQRSLNIFGATVLHRRVSLDDVGLRCRSIIIRTVYRDGSYLYTDVGAVSDIASSIARSVNRSLDDVGGIDRVMQTWNPIITVGEELNMTEWVNEAQQVVAAESRTLRGGQGYEPSEAILYSLDNLARDIVNHNRIDESIRISAVVHVLRDEFALNLKQSQIKEELEARGFAASRLHGLPVIKARKVLMDELLCLTRLIKPLVSSV